MNRTRTPTFESEEEGFIALAFPSPFHFGGSEDVKRDLHQIDDPTTFLLKWYDACVIAHLNLEAGSRIHVHISPRSSCYEFSASNRDLPINVDVLHATCTSWRLDRKKTVSADASVLGWRIEGAGEKGLADVTRISRTSLPAPDKSSK